MNELAPDRWNDTELAWLELVEGDAHAIGERIKLPGTARELRQKARSLLWRAYALLDAVAAAMAAAEGEASGLPIEAQGAGPAPDPNDARVLQAELESLRRDLGEKQGDGVRPLQQVWMRTPMPARLDFSLPSVRLTETVVRSAHRHFRARVAMTAARLAWFDARCSEQTAPTRVATVRQPDTATSSRDSLELLVKVGKSKFS